MPTMIILLAALAAAQASPASSGSDTRIVIPFETGQMRYSLRFWSTGREECVPSVTSQRFAAAAAEACRLALADGAAQRAPGGTLLVEGTITMSVVRAGETPTFAVVPQGASAFVVEADVELAADGTIIGCRPVSFQPRPGMTGGLDEVCPSLRAQGPGLFVPTGRPPWRGRARFVTEAQGPLADRFLAGAPSP